MTVEIHSPERAIRVPLEPVADAPLTFVAPEGVPVLAAAQAEPCRTGTASAVICARGGIGCPIEHPPCDPYRRGA